MKLKTHKILSMILVTALLIGMLCIGSISAGASTSYYDSPLELNVVKSFTGAEVMDRHYMNYTPDRDITVAIESYGDLKMFVHIFDSKSEFISGTDEGGSGNNFRLINHLKAGETYTYIVYCVDIPSGVESADFSVKLSEINIPTDAEELTLEGSTDFAMTDESSDNWYRFTADDSNEFIFETICFPPYWASYENKLHNYRLLTKLYDENINEVSCENSSRVSNTGEYTEKNRYQLVKGKTYYFNLRLVELINSLDEVGGKITVSFTTPKERYIYLSEPEEITQNEIVRIEKSREGEEYSYYYTPSEVYCSFTPKKSGTYRVYYDSIYVDWGFGTGFSYTANAEFYNGNGRYINSSYITTDENGALCTTELDMNAGETYTFMMIIEPNAFMPYSCEFHISEVGSNQPLTYFLGDADNNETVDTNDVTFIRRRLAGMQISIPDATLIKNGDADQNEELEIIDATLIQRYLAEMNVNFPIGESVLSKKIIHVEA